MLRKVTMIYVLAVLGIFVILGTLFGWASLAKDQKMIYQGEKMGAFVSAKTQKPVFLWGSLAMSPQGMSARAAKYISFPYLRDDDFPKVWLDTALENHKAGLHLLVSLDELDNKGINKHFYNNLKEIAAYKSLTKETKGNTGQRDNLKFWVSLIPSAQVSLGEYNSYYLQLKNNLQKDKIENISLIWYPGEVALQNPQDLWQEMGQGIWQEIDGVGFNISYQADLQKFTQLYPLFAGHKEIILNENILDGYLDEPSLGLGIWEELYYTIAWKYPAVSQVYQGLKQGQGDERYKKVIDAMGDKNWLTQLPGPTVNQSGLVSLTSNIKIKGQVELGYLAAPMLQQDLTTIEYKFNADMVRQAHRSPFVLNLDTHDLPNGINQLTMVLYNQKFEIIHKEEFYLQVANQDPLLRSPRIGTPFPLSQKPVYKSPYIPVLMYHDFMDQVPADLVSNTVAIDLFEEHLKVLLNEGYTPVTFNDLNNYLDQKAGLPKKPVLITTDDGYLSNYTLAYPLLKKYQVPATFFVATGHLGTETQMEHFDWAQALEMEKSGLIDLQSHGHWHKPYSYLSEEEMAYETSISFGLIEKNLGKRDVKVLSYPEFRHSKKSKKIVKEQGVELQITNLAKKGTQITKQNVQRIHVHNETTPQDLINTILQLTM